MAAGAAQVSAAVAACVGAVAALLTCFIALRSLLRARAAFQGQNFLALMRELQTDRQRDAREALREHYRIDQNDQRPIRWIVEGRPVRNTELEDACQMLDQAGILVRNKMLGANVILDSWSVTILEVFVVSASYLNDRRTRDPGLWTSFEELAHDAFERHRSGESTAEELLRSRFAKALERLDTSETAEPTASASPEAGSVEHLAG